MNEIERKSWLEHLLFIYFVSCNSFDTILLYTLFLSLTDLADGWKPFRSALMPCVCPAFRSIVCAWAVSPSLPIAYARRGYWSNTNDDDDGNGGAGERLPCLFCPVNFFLFISLVFILHNSVFSLSLSRMVEGENSFFLGDVVVVVVAFIFVFPLGRTPSWSNFTNLHIFFLSLSLNNM